MKQNSQKLKKNKAIETENSMPNFSSRLDTEGEKFGRKEEKSERNFHSAIERKYERSKAMNNQVKGLKLESPII